MTAQKQEEHELATAQLQCRILAHAQKRNEEVGKVGGNQSAAHANETSTDEVQSSLVRWH